MEEERLLFDAVHHLAANTLNYYTLDFRQASPQSATWGPHPVNGSTHLGKKTNIHFKCLFVLNFTPL